MLVVGLLLGGVVGVLIMCVLAASALASVRAQRDSAQRELAELKERLAAVQAGKQRLAISLGGYVIANAHLQHRLAYYEAKAQPRTPSELPS